jgi:hypothetical protein
MTGERILDMRRKQEGEAFFNQEGILCIALWLEATEDLSRTSKSQASAQTCSTTSLRGLRRTKGLAGDGGSMPHQWDSSQAFANALYKVWE